MFAEFEDDEDDYDAVEETPKPRGPTLGGRGAPQAPGVVVPTVDATKATAAAA